MGESQGDSEKRVEEEVAQKSGMKGDVESARQMALNALEQDENWSYSQWRAIAVAGSGFLTDSYDNFVISLLVPMVVAKT